MATKRTMATGQQPLDLAAPTKPQEPGAPPQPDPDDEDGETQDLNVGGGRDEYPD